VVILEGDKHEVTSLAGGDDDVIAAGYTNGIVKLWNMSTAACTTTLRSVYVFVFSYIHIVFVFSYIHIVLVSVYLFVFVAYFSVFYMYTEATVPLKCNIILAHARNVQYK